MALLKMISQQGILYSYRAITALFEAMQTLMHTPVKVTFGTVGWKDEGDIIPSVICTSLCTAADRVAT